MQGFFEKNYQKNLNSKIPRLITTYHLRGCLVNWVVYQLPCP